MVAVLVALGSVVQFVNYALLVLNNKCNSSARPNLMSAIAVKAFVHVEHNKKSGKRVKIKTRTETKKMTM
jgi:hypothetical protein